MRSLRHCATVVLLIVAVSLSGCLYYVPKPDETIYVKVVNKLTIDEISRRTRDVRNALAQGVSRDDIKDGRVAYALCAQKTESGFVERYWTVRLPRDERFIIGLSVSEFAEIIPGAPGDADGPLSRFVRKTAPPSAAELRPLKYSELVACEATSTPGTMRVQMTSTTNGWSLRQYDNAESWIRVLPKDALAEGRLFIATCAVGTEASLNWYVEARRDQPIQIGEIVKAQAGNDISEDGSRLTQVTERFVRNLKYEKMFGGYGVRCTQ